MRHTSSISLSALVMLTVIGCGGEQDATPTAAGASGAAAAGKGGGTAGSAGTAGTGGASGAGASGAGGAAGKGGTAGKGGATAGSAGASGAAGKGGTAGTGGAGGKGGGAGAGGTAGGGGASGKSGASGAGGKGGGAGGKGGGAGVGSGGTSGNSGTSGAAGVGGSGGSNGGASGSGGSSGTGGGSGSGGAGGSGPVYGIDVRPANATCKAPPRPLAGAPDLTVTHVFTDKTFVEPVLLAQAPGDPLHYYVVQRGGRVQVFTEAGPASDFVDLSAKVNNVGEGGLLGMAFHPKFAQNGQVFLSYTAHGGSTDIVSTVSRFTSLDGGLTLDPASEQVLFTVEQPYTNHKGGHLAFGPDGDLYLGLGDGGSGDDVLNNSQSLTTPLGKMLRFDVDGGFPYAIPPDNPFATGGGLPEIYASGFRNPWRYSFDRATGELWVGDVGQSSWEEIDRVKLGGNYGWHVKEGTNCYAQNPCDGPYIDPFVEYDHTVGQAVIGGYVYRGSAIPSLWGTYLFGDFVVGYIWRIVYDPITGAPSQDIAVTSGVNASSMSEDLAGELYVIGFYGDIHRIEPASPSPPDPFPTLLSQTGCVDPTDATQPAPGLIPYGVNAPFWSDGADKSRAFAIPDGTTIDVGADGDLSLPIGSVVVKTFSLAGQRVETRLLVRHDDGGWAGYSYEWNDQGTDATYVPGSKEKVVGGQSWHYPSGAECLSCHTAAAGRTLGLELLQLNGAYAYPGGTANQLDTLDHIKLFTTGLPGAPATLPALPDPFGSDLERSRARAYLHTNCSICHRPTGPGLGSADYRFATPFDQVGACNATPQGGDLGVPGAMLITPGSPATSVVSLRLHSSGATRMPPLGSNVHDASGIALIDSFIASLGDCSPLGFACGEPRLPAAGNSPAAG
jgi:uncharacterized repeat protein (TIGR03806 family)